MSEYHKIKTVFKRDPKYPKRLLEGQFSLPIFEYLYQNLWEVTEKIDGTNIRVMHHPDLEVRFAGKTDNASIPPQLLSHLQSTFTHEKLDPIFPDGAILYGEGYGAKIQNGAGYGSEQRFILFDIFIIPWWLQRKALEDVAEKLSIPLVPLIGHMTLEDAVSLTKNGFKSYIGSCPAEGVICKPSEGLYTRSMERIITKLKTRDFVD